jgi:hypothetical protein
MRGMAAEVVLGAANQTEVEKSLSRDKKDKARKRGQRAQTYGNEKIAELVRIAKIAVGSRVHHRRAQPRS